MSLIKCPECGKEVSTAAETCPHCGYPLKKKNQNESPKPVTYETQTVTIVYWTKDGLDEQLSPYIKNGWEVVTMKENRWRSGLLRHVYDVVLRRAKK